MPNKVEIVVVAKDQSGTTFDKVRAKAKQSGLDAGKDYETGIESGLKGSKKKIEDLGLAPISNLIGAQQRYVKASAAAGEATKKFGKDSQEAANAEMNLARSAIALETAGRRVAKTFGTEMTPAIRDSLKAAGVAENQISHVAKSFESGFKDLAKGLTKDGAEAGRGFAQSFVSETESFLGPGGAAISAAVVGMVAGVAPFVGALLAGAVIGAAGATGLVGGIILAAHDQRVAAALQDLGNDVTHYLTLASVPFVKPVLAGIGQLDGAFNRQAGNIAKIFQTSAQWVAPLGNALETIIDDVGNGFTDLVQGASPVMSALIDGIKDLGSEIGDSFSILSDDGPAAALAVSMAFDAIIDSVRATIVTVDFLASTFGTLAKIGLFGAGSQAEIAAYESELRNTTDAATGAGDSISDMGADAVATADELGKLADALKAQYDPAFALIDAQQKLASAATHAADATKKYGKNSHEAKDANLAWAKSAISMESAAARAAGTFNGKVSPSLRATLKAAGLSDQAIDSVANSFKGAAAAGNKYAKTYRANIVTVFTQIGKPTSYGAGNPLPSNYYHGLRTGGVRGAAYGGAQGGITMVGEDGPELVDLPLGSRVRTAGKTKQDMGWENGGGNASGGATSINFSFTGNMDSMFATAFQKALNAGLIKISLARNTVA